MIHTLAKNSLLPPTNDSDRYNLATGPDGALYIADMYSGLIQHGAYVTPYLREQTLSRKLVLPVNRGRIWRIVQEDWAPKNQRSSRQCHCRNWLATSLIRMDGTGIWLSD